MRAYQQVIRLDCEQECIMKAHALRDSSVTTYICTCKSVWIGGRQQANKQCLNLQLLQSTRMRVWLAGEGVQAYPVLRDAGSSALTGPV